MIELLRILREDRALPLGRVGAIGSFPQLNRRDRLILGHSQVIVQLTFVSRIDLNRFHLCHYLTSIPKPATRLSRSSVIFVEAAFRSNLRCAMAVFRDA